MYNFQKRKEIYHEYAFSIRLLAWSLAVCLFSDTEFPLTLPWNVYLGLMRGELDSAP